MLDLRVWGVVGIACSAPVCRVGQVHAEVIFRPSAMHAKNKPLKDLCTPKENTLRIFINGRTDGKIDHDRVHND